MRGIELFPLSSSSFLRILGGHVEFVLVAIRFIVTVPVITNMNYVTAARIIMERRHTWSWYVHLI